ncbi:hypothetical protein B7494_g8205 [Chlorociboria aeruginascens]|nr:hypothetical protein B7494_g8205 [Chlorociboria aeruginascens]
MAVTPESRLSLPPSMTMTLCPDALTLPKTPSLRSGCTCRVLVMAVPVRAWAGTSSHALPAWFTALFTARFTPVGILSRESPVGVCSDASVLVLIIAVPPRPSMERALALAR